jgi:hypothetical protein
VTDWTPLDPYKGQEPEPLTGQELRELVAFYKRTADQNGEPYDPEWDQWIADDEAGTPPPPERA